ncbi:MAG: prolipoprotein diacylglyceryl transferase [Rhodospirillales bacterium]
MFFALSFPTIDPVLIEIGPIVVRWYALAYLAGLLIGWRMMLRLADGSGGALTRTHVDDFLVWATFGVILGGRIGYALFYRPGFYLDNPLELLAVWQGGMSFHGGIAGVVVAALWFARRHDLAVLQFGDMIARVAPVGLFFGRIANFVNAELFGRVTDAPWGMVFPTGGPQPRHPSQLYEAALEGLALFIIINLLARNARVQARPGTLVGVFLIGYGVFRTAVEFVREPDAHLGLIAGPFTMGQVLSLPMILAGLAFVVYARRHVRS